MLSTVEFTGIVTAVAPAFKHLQVGNRAVSWASNHFGISERAPGRSVCKLLDHEQFNIVPTLLIMNLGRVFPTLGISSRLGSVNFCTQASQP
jgi:hypothetical protein